MNSQFNAENKRLREYALTENHPFRLARAKGSMVKCIAGKAWITAYDNAEDFILKPGDVFVVPNDGLALVEAIGDCRVQIVPLDAAVHSPSYSPALTLLKRAGEKYIWMSCLGVLRKGGN